MGRKATTIDEQLKILHSRGMVFDCGEEKVKEHLADIGYYRLGFYWNPFETDEDHNFADGTKFSTVIKLYYMDVDLRHLLSRALYRIEINIRTQLIYFASNEYPDSPTWFSDPKVMRQKFVRDFPKYYNQKFKDNNKPIKYHHQKYINDKYAPAWKTLEFLTFGSIFSIYYNLKSENLKKVVAKFYGFKKTDIFINYFRTIIFIRNICAHSGLLYDVSTPLGIKSTPLIQIKNNNRHSLDTAIQVILHFLGVISPNRKKEITGQIEALFAKNAETPEIKNIISEKIGF